MPSAERTVRVAHALLHIGGLSGAAAFLAEGQMGAALLLAVVATACVVILAGGNALVQIMGVKVRRYLRKYEERVQLPEPRDKVGPDA